MSEHTAENDAWTDRHGDVWRLGPDGLMHTPETAPFPREHVEKKWGPLRPTRVIARSPQWRTIVPAASTNRAGGCSHPLMLIRAMPHFNCR